MKKKIFKKRITGLIAKRHGQLFEKEFENACIRDNVQFINLPDFGARFINSKKFIRENICFDILIFKKGKILFLDLKSIECGVGLNYSRVHSKPHQIKELHKLKSEGFGAGYLIKVANLNDEIYYCDINAVNKMKKGTSIKFNSMLKVGSLKNENCVTNFLNLCG